MRFWGLVIAAFLFALLSIIPLRLAIAHSQAPRPQAILTLGGDRVREEFTAQFAQKHPALDIWVSSGIHPDQTRAIFRAAGIPPARLHIDCRAVDTVTNFTSLVGDFKKRHFRHLYVITANFHMPRAQAIANIVLGSQGIAVTPVAIPNLAPHRKYSPESWGHTLRDSLRSIVWIVTHRTGASLNPRPVHPCT